MRLFVSEQLELDGTTTEHFMIFDTSDNEIGIELISKGVVITGYLSPEQAHKIAAFIISLCDKIEGKRG